MIAGRPDTVCNLMLVTNRRAFIKIRRERDLDQVHVQQIAFDEIFVTCSTHQQHRPLSGRPIFGVGRLDGVENIQLVWCHYTGRHQMIQGREAFLHARADVAIDKRLNEDHVADERPTNTTRLFAVAAYMRRDCQRRTKSNDWEAFHSFTCQPIQHCGRSPAIDWKLRRRKNPAWTWLGCSRCKCRKNTKGPRKWFDSPRLAKSDKSTLTERREEAREEVRSRPTSRCCLSNEKADDECRKRWTMKRPTSKWLSLGELGWVWSFNRKKNLNFFLDFSSSNEREKESKEWKGDPYYSTSKWKRLTMRKT